MSNNKKKIVIFGATGGVGSYLSLELVNEYELICVGRRDSDNGFFSSIGAEYVSLDIINPNEFDRLPQEGVYAVVHLAGDMPSKMKGYDPSRYIDSILKGTLNILDYTKKVSADRIIFTQTRADSGHLMGTLEPIPSDINKTFPKTGDHSIYAICKNAAVDIIEHYYESFGIKRFILRLPTIYSYSPDKHFYVNGEKKIKAYRKLIDSAVKGEDIEVWGDPSMTKEIVYVKDLTYMISLCLEATVSGGMYNVGGQKGISLEEQIQGIIDVFSEDKVSNKIYLPEKPNSRQFIHDISKPKNELGYSPRYTYIDMLIDMKKEDSGSKLDILWKR